MTFPTCDHSANKCFDVDMPGHLAAEFLDRANAEVPSMTRVETLDPRETMTDWEILQAEAPTFTCACGEELRYGGFTVTCNRCEAEYNGSGQRLRSNWRSNASLYDDEVGDLEGYELASLESEEFGY
jgi:hypothetical protein